MIKHRNADKQEICTKQSWKAMYRDGKHLNCSINMIYYDYSFFFFRTFRKFIISNNNLKCKDSGKEISKITLKKIILLGKNRKDQTLLLRQY